MTDSSTTDLQKILELRIFLEGFCARLAAQRITEEQIEKMKAALQDLEETHGGQHQSLMSIDRRFHRLLYAAADNEFLGERLERLYDLSVSAWNMIPQHLAGVTDAIKRCGDVLEALKARDGAEAEALIREHIIALQQAISKVLG
jgi:DNA-binding FadR family transcriptional regulator